MPKLKVTLIGGDNTNWALDNDLALTKQALKDIVTFVDITSCDVIHSVSWLDILNVPENLLASKRVVCHIPGEPFRYLMLPHASEAFKWVDKWVAQSTQAQTEMAQLNVRSHLIPYAIDTNTFFYLPKNNAELISFKKKWSIPEDKYIISNFHRDTEGYDLTSPKLVKGPDVFVEIVRTLVTRGYNIHILLAGPRRFWIREQLDRLNIPYTFIGTLLNNCDDYSKNTLTQSTLNLLYNLSDLYLVSSRSEGGPRSILEAAATKCKIVSSNVGLAPDVLSSKCIYQTPDKAIDIISKDIETNYLANTLNLQYQRIKSEHRPEVTRQLFQKLYDQIAKTPQKTLSINSTPTPKRFYPLLKQSTFMLQHNRFGRFWRRYLKPIFGSGRRYLEWMKIFLSRQPSDLTISLWHKFMKPPYGGGNQFMLGLRKALQAKNITVVENQLHPSVNVYLLNAIHFDVEAFVRFSQHHKLNIVHRIDGPIQLIRGYDQEKDELTYALNQRFASATVIQSFWTYQRIIELGYHPVNPIVIHNGVDTDIFHPIGRISFNKNRKIRLISSSWSDNPRKGGPIYKWIEEHLDWERFEYTFVGRASEKFERIHQIPPVPSEELADILRHHDIYITASRSDPCSNALIEALACGLPALYFNDGGHPELVGFGGLPFNNEAEIMPQLDILIENYELFQNLIVISSMDEVAKKYLDLFKQIS